MAVRKFRADQPSPAWLAPIKYTGALLLVAFVYFALAKLGLQLASINPSASPIWPPTGLALAAVLLGGYRIWPAIFVSAFAANATTAGTLETSAVIALGNTLEGLAGGYLINLWAGGREAFATPARVAKFVLIGAGPATVISASIGVLTLAIAGFAPWEKFVPIWTTWWLGDVAGALVVTPVIVLWADSARRAFDYRELPDAIAVLGCGGGGGLYRLQPVAATLGIYKPARLPGDPAVAVGSAAPRPPRYRDCRAYSHGLRRLGDNQSCRSVRRHGAQRVLPAAAHFHDQRFGAEPGAQRGRRDATRERGKSSAHPRRPRSAASRNAPPSLPTPISSSRKHSAWPISAAGRGTSSPTGFPGRTSCSASTASPATSSTAPSTISSAGFIRTTAPGSAPASLHRSNPAPVSAMRSASCGPMARSAICKA